MRMIPISLFALAITGAIAQDPSKMTVAPVPADPRELVSAAVQVASTPDERASVLSLLERAKQNSDLHMPGTPPFQMKLTFNAGGNVATTGAGEISETWLSGRMWRYEQTLGNYSQIRIGNNGQVFDDKPIDAAPTRVQMLRSAFFWPVSGAPSDTIIRSAAAEWNGKPVTCALFSLNSSPRAAPGRHWDEREFCVDNASGLLQIYSEAPGTYVVYGYGRNLQFHGRRLADQIQAYVSGAPVLDAQLVSFEDASSVDPASLKPAEGMVPALSQAGFIFGHVMRFTIAPPGFTPKAVSPVVVHVAVSTKGNVTEAEISASPDPALSQAAMDFVKSTNFNPGPTQRDLYVTVRFLPSSPPESASLRN